MGQNSHSNRTTTREAIGHKPMALKGKSALSELQARVINLDSATDRKVNLASAAYGLSSGEFVRASIQAALDTCAERERYLSSAFAMVDESEQGRSQGDRCVSMTRVPVPA